MGCRSFVGLSSVTAVTASQHLHQEGRFLMQKVAAMGKGGVHAGSAYFHDTVGPDAKLNRELRETMAFTLNSLKGPWILGADWNCTPAELQATGWLQKVGGVVCAPRAATYNGKVKDFLWYQHPLPKLRKACTSLQTLASTRTRLCDSTLRECRELLGSGRSRCPSASPLCCLTVLPTSSSISLTEAISR